MSHPLIKNVSDTSFQADVLEASQPVLLDFWAEWCGPCKMIAPVLEEIANDYVGRLQVAKINTEENMAIPTQYGIRGIPTLILFNKGQVLATQVGALSKGQLKAFIDQHIV